MVIDLENSLVSDGLQLQPLQETTKVPNPTEEPRKFKQDLYYRNCRFIIRTAPITSNKVEIKENQYGKYVSFPVDPWMRQQFDTIEKFVISNLVIPPMLDGQWKARSQDDTPYKMMWNGPQLYIPLSNWFSCLRCDDNYLSEIDISKIGEGFVSIALSPISVYLGPHKSNKIASLSLYVQSILFTPKEEDLSNISAEVNLEGSFKHVKNAKRRRRKEDQ